MSETGDPLSEYSIFSRISMRFSASASSTPTSSISDCILTCILTIYCMHVLCSAASACAFPRLPFSHPYLSNVSLYINIHIHLISCYMHVVVSRISIHFSASAISTPTSSMSECILTYTLTLYYMPMFIQPHQHALFRVCHFHTYIFTMSVCVLTYLLTLCHMHVVVSRISTHIYIYFQCTICIWTYIRHYVFYIMYKRCYTVFLHVDIHFQYTICIWTYIRNYETCMIYK